MLLPPLCGGRRFHLLADVERMHHHLMQLPAIALAFAGG
jgi:hypothetical protein